MMSSRGSSTTLISEVKAALANEGYSSIQDQLYGLSISKALRDRCNANYVAPAVEA